MFLNPFCSSGPRGWKLTVSWSRWIARRLVKRTQTAPTGPSSGGFHVLLHSNVSVRFRYRARCHLLAGCPDKRGREIDSPSSPVYPAMVAPLSCPHITTHVRCLARALVTLRTTSAQCWNLTLEWDSRQIFILKLNLKEHNLPVPVSKCSFSIKLEQTLSVRLAALKQLFVVGRSYNIIVL